MSKYVIVNGELYHHGILGMKWGIRRYQNPDGSLTEAGRNRYAKFEKKIAKQERKIEKWQKKLDKNAGKDYRATKKRMKAARLKNKAYNGLFLSNKKREKLKFKAERLEAKADKMQNKTLKYEVKIRKAQSLINKYNRKLDKLDPNRVNKGSRYISGYSDRKLSDLRR